VLARNRNGKLQMVTLSDTSSAAGIEGAMSLLTRTLSSMYYGFPSCALNGVPAGRVSLNAILPIPLNLPVAVPKYY
jgi:hypothetical protein